MAIHPSLNISEKDKKARSVLKRTERLRMMAEKGEWKEGDNVYGLPKIKTVRLKIKKEKVEKAETATGTTPAEAPATATKESAPKAAPAKSTEKK